MKELKKLEFLQKLANLLGEYNAEVGINCDENSDLNGVSLVISLCSDEIFEASRYSIDSMDINNYIKGFR